MENRLYYGDCLDVLRTLPDECVDLIYLDPPFNSKKNYNAFFATATGKHTNAQITAFKDTWHWGKQAEKEYGDLLKNPDAGTLGESLIPALRHYLRQSDMMAYIVMMASRLVELKRVLKQTGSLYLHCDPTASHYLRILLDGIFGTNNFKNEIVWKRTSAHSDAKSSLASLHDVIFHYTKSDIHIFNRQFKCYTEQYITKRHNKTDEDGRRYMDGDLSAKGLAGGGYEYEFNGINGYWRVSKQRMTELFEQNRLYFTKNGGIRIKRYLDEMPGLPIGDLWDDIYPINSQSKERLGYPTQKPVDLLERIIKSSSNEGDVILDPFCGCGTAVHAAEKLNRKWIGIDITHLAIGLIRQRLHRAFPECQFVEEGTPKDVASARYLAESNGLHGRYQFQYWVLFLAGALPSQSKKKGPDAGIDGYIWFHDSPDAKTAPKKIIFSVKSGKIPANHIRELTGMLKAPAEIAVLLTLEEPSRIMDADAVAVGSFAYPNGHEVPRIQILTVQQLLDGKRPDFLDYGEGSAMNKQAKREIAKLERGGLG